MDELAFHVDREGRVILSINNGASRIIMHVDHSQRLWLFFDVYGNTQTIHIAGTVENIYNI